MFKRDPQGFVPGFDVQEGDDVPGFNVRQEDAFPWINVGPEDVQASQRKPSGIESDPNVVPAAQGDLRCEMCGAGKASGTTGAFVINGKVQCPKCAVKSLGYTDVPSSELPDLMYRYLLRPNSR